MNADNKSFKKLYENAVKLKFIKPWDYIDDGDIITIMFNDKEEPTWVSLIGKGEFLTAFCIIKGVDALIKYNMIHRGYNIPVEQMSRFNDNYICYFANREDVPEKDYRLIKKLGYSFRGKKEWIFFRYLDSVYEPRLLNNNEAEYVAAVVEQIYYSVLEIKKGLKVDFNNGKTLLRRFSSANNWITREADLYVPNMQLHLVHITDEVLIKRLNKQEFIGGTFEFDISYVNAVISDNLFDRNVRTRIALLSDLETGTIVNEKLMNPREEDINSVFDIVFGYIINVGKPKKIIVRDLFIYSMLVDTMHILNIDIEISQRLEVIDCFLSELNAV